MYINKILNFLSTPFKTNILKFCVSPHQYLIVYLENTCMNHFSNMKTSFKPKVGYERFPSSDESVFIIITLVMRFL